MRGSRHIQQLREQVFGRGVVKICLGHEASNRSLQRVRGGRYGEVG